MVYALTAKVYALTAIDNLKKLHFIRKVENAYRRPRLDYLMAVQKLQHNLVKFVWILKHRKVTNTW
jgi:hypothetical protein